MSGLLINNVLYGVGGGGVSGSGLIEITYAEYLANKAKYDASGKAYAIPDYPSSGGSLEGWTLWRETGYIPAEWTTLTITEPLSNYSEINIVPRRYTNQVIDSIIIPTDLFRTLNTANSASVKIERDDISLDVQYVDDNTIRARNTGSTQNVMFSIYARAQNDKVYGEVPTGGYDPTKYTRLEGTGCVVLYNDFDVVINITASGLNLTGGNIAAPANNKVATLPSNVKVKLIQFTNSVDVMDSSWTPTGNTMVMMIQTSSIFGRCRNNATNGVITHTVTIPRFLVDIT